MSKEAEENTDQQTDQAAESTSTDTSTLDVEAAVEAKMAEINAKVDAEAEADHAGNVTEESAENAEEAVVTDKSEDADSDESPTLPTGHRRAALARGWTNEEVDHYIEIKPEEATAKFESIFDDWQQENSQWSARGRELMRAKQTGLSESATEAQETEHQKVDFEPIDPKAFAEEYDVNEVLMEALAKKLNPVISNAKVMSEQLEGYAKTAQVSNEETLSKITQDFLTSKEMKPFADVYGTDINTLTKEQLDSRMELFGQADEIVQGALAHGREITVQEALERAHDSVSHDSRDTTIRKEIRDSMTKRTKTLTGSKRKIEAPKDDGPISEEELEARVGAKQQAIRDKM